MLTKAKAKLQSCIENEYGELIANPCRRVLFHMQMRCCFYCREPMELHGKKHERATEDHVIPKSKGMRKLGNIVLAHEACNVKKGDRMPTNRELERLARLYQRLRELYGYKAVYRRAPTPRVSVPVHAVPMRSDAGTGEEETCVSG